MRSIAEIILKSAGYLVEIACDGQDALEKLQANPGEFDILVTDINMPRLGGLELINKLEKMNLSIKVVVISATPSKENDNLLQQEHQIDGFLSKPYKPRSLLEYIKKFRN